MPITQSMWSKNSVGKTMAWCICSCVPRKLNRYESKLLWEKPLFETAMECDDRTCKPGWGCPCPCPDGRTSRRCSWSNGNTNKRWNTRIHHDNKVFLRDFINRIYFEKERGENQTGWAGILYTFQNNGATVISPGVNRKKSANFVSVKNIDNDICCNAWWFRIFSISRGWRQIGWYEYKKRAIKEWMGTKISIK